MFNLQGLKRYLANTTWLFTEQMVSRVIALLLSIYVARYLGPEQLGLLNYALSLVGLFSLIATLGLDDIVVRELVKNGANRDRLLGTAWVLKLAGAVFLIVILLVVLWKTGQDYPGSLMVLVIATATLFQSFNVIDFHFRSQVASKYPAIAKFVSNLINLALTLYLIFTNAELLWFALLVSINSLSFSIGLMLVYKLKNFSISQWRYSIDLARSLLKESWPLIMSMAVISLYIHADKVIIQHLLGSVATGEYSIGSRLSEAWYFLPVIIVNSLFPAIVRAKNSSGEHYYKRLQNLYDLMVWLAITIAVPVAWYAEEIILLLYGEAYSNAVGVLQIHVWAGVFVFVGMASGRWMIVEGYNYKFFFRSLGGVLINIGLNFYLIPQFGIKGAAVATLLAQVFVVIIFDALHPDTRISFRMKMKSYLPIHLLRL